MSNESISKKVKGVTMQKNVLQDFHICISVRYELVKENLKKLFFKGFHKLLEKLFFLFRYDDKLFFEAVIEACIYQKKRGK